jgi:hypothetical protein
LSGHFLWFTEKSRASTFSSFSLLIAEQICSGSKTQAIAGKPDRLSSLTEVRFFISFATCCDAREFSETYLSVEGSNLLTVTYP